ncbi:MAG: DUF4124 domain-containing protein [Paucibacter sp.]|nr:DUF4124 domain-containing protein [Roseateles sp.]
MKISFNISILLLALAGTPTLAAAQIYLCTDASGHKELTDTSRPGCKLLDVPGATIPAPPRHGGSGGGGRESAARPYSPPPGYPSVDNAEQRARDADRRGILEEELKNEQQKLADLRKEFNNGEPERRGDERNYAKYQERVASLRDSISRSEKNVEALKREIANIR